ncbi:cytidine triphosphate synthetase, putative [Plasmodium knowlesi strain H]|uniref:CTP synthase n=3 Tax=Plasmodium knowlesi TaxID=5850 RepID=A0A5K1V4S6_PLAKH|nr:CTP synthase, putative [Plasmodium knowlesi strain H]OTN67872.1 putative Cytidine triphosphate synthetase [Plasmodium knowlesi]CAA9990506.1 CTP synthase, putative [Plasmodium knowlesi strain H]SBO19738.1 cytidine triphosphate synthetase, putative [Plasmodium knowlesi strain H]SBO22457.1 cytidine triphosphate synthetase, putative [Plasmodium knowlesi strain H]VVS79980.1 CTP synthase, putative [Plasmodium knowlesi strain H]|eukprot:XP_002260896.1 cytidine triphosphate synthetase, putative [Plasmodium knowlesi strain H]
MDSTEDVNTITKYIIVTGGNMSGLGKGTAMSSMGVLLLTKNILLTTIKIDPYLNIDAGTMSPYEHGEVYVLEDGGEVDLDLGNYERFLNIKLSYKNNITSGKVYEEVIKKERKGEYLGKTVQVVPHVTDAIQNWIKGVIDDNIKRMKKEYNITASSTPNTVPCICMIEVGGTVGDIESAVYLEALQQLINNLNSDDVCLCHLSYVPIMGTLREQKTKPTQHSVKILREAGLKPDFIFCRCEEPLTEEAIQKISLFSQVKNEHVISLHDTSNLYKVPLILEQQNFSANVLKKLNLQNTVLKNKLQISPYSFSTWKHLSDRYESSNESVVIGIVGKYTASNDTYLSIISSLVHACIECGFKLIIKYINSSHLSLKKKSKKKNIDLKRKARKYAYDTCSENNTTQKHLFVDDTTSDEDYDKKRKMKYERAWDILRSVDGILVPGGFGTRGIEGKYLSSKYCRMHNVPYLGICLGMQTAVIDVARQYLNKYASSEEFEDLVDVHNNSDDKMINKKKREFNKCATDNSGGENEFTKVAEKDIFSGSRESRKGRSHTDDVCFEMKKENPQVRPNLDGTKNIPQSNLPHNEDNDSETHSQKKHAISACSTNEENSNSIGLEAIEGGENDHSGIDGPNSKMGKAKKEYSANSHVDMMNGHSSSPCDQGEGPSDIADLLATQKYIEDIPNKMADPELLEKIKLMGIEDYYKSIDEIDNNNVIISMNEFKGDDNKGGTMRLGVKQSKVIDKDSLTYKAYDEAMYIFERHRHRFEINPKYVPLLESVGLSFVAKDIDSVRMEICEMKKLNFYVGVQFHPEFTSRPFKANPLFLAFILASKGKLKERLDKYGNKLCSGSLYR